MRCTRCGRRIDGVVYEAPDNASYCVECAARLPQAPTISAAKPSPGNEVVPGVYSAFPSSEGSPQRPQERSPLAFPAPLCPSCGREISAKKKFCRHCGAALTVDRTHESASVLEQAPSCLKCGGDIRPGKKFCGHCGAKLEHCETAKATPRGDSSDERHVETPLEERPSPQTERLVGSGIADSRFSGDFEPRATAPESGSKIEIYTEMSKAEVMQVLGDPLREIVFGDKTILRFADVTVELLGGKVVDLRPT